jgi:hypothetical protein
VAYRLNGGFGTADVALFAEGGNFTHGTAHTSSGSFDGEVASTAFHATFGVGLSWAFTP